MLLDVHYVIDTVVCLGCDPYCYPLVPFQPTVARRLTGVLRPKGPPGMSAKSLLRRLAAI